ncbi:hypothetical protein BH09MYX1_BH09MYX1_21330 [soil metagenome]
MARTGLKHLASAFVALGAVTLWLGCSSTPAGCDSSKCATGNKCLLGFATADAEQANAGATTSCKLPCDKQDACPFNYHCSGVNGVGGTDTYCVPDRPSGKPYAKKDTGQWGYACDPTKGLDTNPACDSAQNFWCYASSPTDGGAFCTQYQCKDDGDCRGGYYCATVNTAPNATTATRSYGDTTTVCLPRTWTGSPNTYCAPCKADIDCPLNQGLPQHCVGLGDGSETVCASECTSNANCTRDAVCADAGLGVNICAPRAGTCKGAGKYCGPCHSDKECGDGFCVGPETGDLATSYSTEHFCTAKSKVACVAQGMSLTASDCPASPAGSTSCVASVKNGNPVTGKLADQCFGLWTFNGSNVVGCWSNK